MLMEAVDIQDRVTLYIRNVEEALRKVKDNAPSSDRARYVIELAESYLRDSIHYAKVGDFETALATISYAEGLLDALRILNLVDVEWRRPSELSKNLRKVFVAGTFDIIHPGHLEYLKYAWSLGRVVAVVATDEGVRRVKGRDPVIPAEQRVEVLSAIQYVYKARVGYEDDMFRVVEEEKPDVILLGPNQPFSEDYVKRALRDRGIEAEVVRMPKLRECPLCSTSSIIRRILSMGAIANNGR